MSRPLIMHRPENLVLHGMSMEQELVTVMEKCRMRKPRVLTNRRDELMKLLYIEGMKVSRLEELTGLTNIRIYQIIHDVIGQSKSRTRAA